jgi:hypothetical protein
MWVTLAAGPLGSSARSLLPAPPALPAAGLLGDANAFSKEYACPIAMARDADASEAQVAKGMAAMNRLMETVSRCAG